MRRQNSCQLKHIGTYVQFASCQLSIVLQKKNHNEYSAQIPLSAVLTAQFCSAKAVPPRLESFGGIAAPLRFFLLTELSQPKTLLTCPRKRARSPMPRFSSPHAEFFITPIHLFSLDHDRPHFSHQQMHRPPPSGKKSPIFMPGTF